MPIYPINQNVHFAATHASQLALSTTPPTRIKETICDSVDLVGGTMGSSSPEGSLFAVMQDYQKMMNQETREDRQLSRKGAIPALVSKDSKIERDSEKINEMKEEAGARFDSAMGGANLGMILGVAGAASAVSSVVAKNSDATQRTISENEQAINRAAVHADDSKDVADATRDQRQAMKDSIHKFLDILRGINPRI